MACSNPSVTILSKYLCIPQVINCLPLSLWTTQANALLDSIFSSNPFWHPQVTGTNCLTSQAILLPDVLAEFRAIVFNLHLVLKIGTFWSSVVCLKACLTLPSTTAIPSPYKFWPSWLLTGHSEIADFCLFWKTVPNAKKPRILIHQVNDFPLQLRRESIRIMQLGSGKHAIRERSEKVGEDKQYSV